MRNPRRTAQTAAALMIGLGLVSAIAVLGASLSRSAEQQVDSAVSADYLITGSGDSVSRLLRRSRASRESPRRRPYTEGQFEFRGSLATLAAATPAHLRRTITLDITAGSGAAAMAAGRLLIDTTTADKDHLHVGADRYPVKFAQTGLDHDQGRRDLQVQPARRQFRRRRALLPFALRQPAPGRCPDQHRAGRGRPGQGTQSGVASLRKCGLQDPGAVRAGPAARDQPGARTCLRPARAGGGRRADRDRQHADAVGVRANARDRPAAGGRHETSPGPDDDPLGVGDHRAVRRRGRHRDRDRAWASRSWPPHCATTASPASRSRLPASSASWCCPLCSASRQAAGRRAGPPSSTC